MGGRRLVRWVVGVMGGMGRGMGLGRDMVVVDMEDMVEGLLDMKEGTLLVVAAVMVEEDMVRLRPTTGEDTSEDMEAYELQNNGKDSLRI